jgi:signal transduction histidine kinase
VSPSARRASASAPSRATPPTTLRWGGLPAASRRTVTWALAGYLVTVAVGVGIVGRSAVDTPTGIAFGVAFLLAAGVVVGAFWRFAERAYAQQEQYRRELFDAEMGALARLREAGQIREDVIASVSHEFRTPLTAIRGSAATLLARADRISPDDRRALLAGIVEHAERLGRLLEDMLLAASAPAVDRGGVADVSAAVAGFNLDATKPPVTLDVESCLAAYIDAVSLDQIIRALADHVRAEARRDRPVDVRARRQAGEVVLDVSYAAASGEQDLHRLFEPFGSRESAQTGRPASLALYVVRRLVEAHGGRVSAGRLAGRVPAPRVPTGRDSAARHDTAGRRGPAAVRGSAAGRDGEVTRVRVALRALRPAASETAGAQTTAAAAAAGETERGDVSTPAPAATV